MSLVSIVLVHYRDTEDAAAALESVCRETREHDLEVIIVDNEGNRRARERLLSLKPEATWLTAPDNPGFATAVNLALQRASGDWILLLNPDARLHERTLRPVPGLCGETGHRTRRHRLSAHRARRVVPKEFLSSRNLARTACRPGQPAACTTVSKAPCTRLPCRKERRYSSATASEFPHDRRGAGIISSCPPQSGSTCRWARRGLFPLLRGNRFLSSNSKNGGSRPLFRRSYRATRRNEPPRIDSPTAPGRPLRGSARPETAWRPRLRLLSPPPIPEPCDGAHRVALTEQGKTSPRPNARARLAPLRLAASSHPAALRKTPEFERIAAARRLIGSQTPRKTRCTEPFQPAEAQPSNSNTLVYARRRVE